MSGPPVAVVLQVWHVSTMRNETRLLVRWCCTRRQSLRSTYVYSSEPRRIGRRFTRSAFERSEPEQPTDERARLRQRPARRSAASAVRFPARRSAVRVSAAVRCLQRSGPALWFAAVTALWFAAGAEPEPLRPERPGPAPVRPGPERSGPVRPGPGPLRAGSIRPGPRPRRARPLLEDLVPVEPVRCLC